MVQIIQSARLMYARKQYRDNTRDFIEPCITDIWNDLSIFQQKTLDEVRAKQWVIHKGDLYECGTYKYDNQIYKFRSHPGLHQICLDFDLYGQD